MALEFDSRYYLQNNPDVAAAISRGLIASAEDHYNMYGRFEARNPNAYFNTSFYLTEYPDVAAAGVNPLQHFLTFGAAEDRFTNATIANLVDSDGNGLANEFDATTYLNANPDVAQAVKSGVFANAYQHFVEFGQFEARAGAQTLSGQSLAASLTNDGSLTLKGIVSPATTEVLNGTSTSDVIVAPDGTLANGTTINAGAGNDTLIVRATSAGGPVAPTLNSVENVIINNTSGASYTFNAANALGTTSFTSRGQTSGSVTQINNVSSSASLNLDNAHGTTNFNISGVANRGGTSDAVTLSVSNGSTATVGITNASGAADTSFETLNLKVNGAASTLNVATGGANLSSLVVAGAGDALTLTEAGGFASLKTIDASGLTGTGGLTLTAAGNVANFAFTGSSQADTLALTAAPLATAVISLGAGDDRVAFASAPVNGAMIDGGAGTDTIAMTSSAYTTVSGYSATDLAKITNFEVLAITDTLANGASVDVSKLAGITSFSAEAGVAAGGAATVTGVTSGSTVTFGGALSTNTGSLAITVTGASTGTADVLNLNIHGSELASTATVTTSTAGIETLNVNAAGVNASSVSTFTLTLTDDALKNLNITGNDKLAFTSAATQTSLASIDASSNTAGVTINVSAATAASSAINITGTTTADTFTLGNHATVAGHGGNDAFVIGVTANANTYSTITDANAGDTISFSTAASSFATGKVTLANTAVFQDYVNAAASGTSGGHQVSWFQYGGDTYVVEDNSTATSFVNGADTVVKLTGLHDLSTSTYASGTVTLA
ncbi:beta strand repeat-containing protein [Aureimonas sp. N4]|uniref:beta strand repeat-containing protein n=1 Tax=Aureimonas sp. N4 TaxID=1638165 RepID=UPI000781E9B0|nr:hypothetical protein [Aureimonas sp. N4]